MYITGALKLKIINKGRIFGFLNLVICYIIILKVGGSCNERLY